ncbi:MAG TPA: amino acid adenylation domain-containing protein, partial [Thermoanaerobaculia bacterium]|nr:amino acid adenylation domain-containing protein [Thermoanaerobaculia bacterium]
TPLATGASLAAPAPDDLLAPGRLAAWAARQGITVAHLTPALGRVMTEGESAVVPSLRWVLLVGDVLTRLDVDRLRRIAPSVTCVNLYGSTETQRAVAFHVVEEDGPAQVLPLGRGMRDVQLLVLRPAGPPALAGIGEVGEICVRSPHLAAGYLGDEAGTRERFRTNPFTGRPGDRIYRTGDLGRYLPNGEVTFAGRADQQVKIRGFRIELGEIEAALGRLPGVREAVVVARQDGADPASRRLVAYVVGETAVDLRQALAAKLPAYMVPSAVVFLDRMPVTPNGKVDRRALPVPEAGLPADFAEPESDLERMVAEVFREVLGVGRVGLHDSFFDLGGHSLLGTSLLSRLRHRFGMELPLRALFAEPTVAGFARRIGERLRSGGSELPAPPPLVPRPREGDPPLSFAQQRLWFLDRLNPGNPFYNLGGGVRLSGPLDAARLARGLAEVARRHEILRTGFVEVEGRPVQRIAPDLSLDIPVLDLSDLPSEVPRIAREQARVPFDLTRPGLLRVTLLRLGEGEHVLLWTIHHIISDAWSNAVLMGEVAALYAGQPLPALPVQYADFAVWQREWLAGETLERQLAYWRERLAGAPVVELPTDRPRPPVQTFRGATHRTVYARPLLDSLNVLARQRDASLFMTLLAAFDVLLCRFTGEEDAVVGAPIANRAQPALERLIGFFINTLVLRTDCAGDPPFLDLLARVKETALGAYAHQDLPFEQLVEALEPRRDLSRNPLFQVMLNLLNAPPPRVELASDLEMTPLPPTDGTALFDLQAYVTEAPEGLRIAWEHNTDLFDPGTIERLSRSFEALLSGIVAAPEARLWDLPLLSPEERGEILVRWNGTAAPVPEPGTIHALFEAQVERTPEAVALVFEGETLTYAGLNARANRAAHHLRSLGVGPEVLVGLRFERSVPAVVAVLAVLKAGGAYIPLDPALPAERLTFLLEDSGAALVLTELAEAEDDTNPTPLAGPGNLAYVLYTSGSTGKPKGVAVTHRGVVNFLASVARRPGLAPGDAVLAVTTLSFDIAGYELLLPLTVGARIVLVSRETAMDGERLAAVLSAERVTRVQVTPATWRLLLGSGWQGDPRLMALSGGEALPRDLARELLPRVASLWNFYGPTETTIWSSVHRVMEAEGAIPIGLPVANTAIHLLDRRLEPVPLGVAGELYIGGAGVSRGYLRRPDLTAERFVPDPFSSGERLYRTGDLARRLPGGEIDFLGRADHQVKIRGFRVEPGEIEAVLAEDPAVRQAAVVLREVDGDPRLVAWLVWEEGREGDPRVLRERLRERLPAYMIPSGLLSLPALPLTPSGKVDRRALAAREDAAERSLSFADHFVPPRTPAEQQMADLFAEVLGLPGERVGAHDSFFELGGHSLLATRLVSRVRAAFGADLPLRALFEAPTVAGLTAAALAGGEGAQEPGIRRLHA